MIRKLMLDIEHYWPELQQKYPAFQKPILIPAAAIRKEIPFYMKRYLDQDPDSNYMFFKCDVTKGASDRETAAMLFKELFHDKLGLPSSYERDEGLSPEEAARKELLPADNDRNYRNFFEEQMDILRQQMDAEDKERKEQEWEREHGWRRDDPDIIDADVVDPDAPAARPKPAGNAVAAAGRFAVGQLKPIWYGVDLHIPAGGALGWDGAGGGRIGRRDPRGPRGFLREDEKLNEGGVVREIKPASIAKGGLLFTLDGFIENTKNEMVYTKESAELTLKTQTAFEYKENRKQQFESVAVKSFNNGVLVLEDGRAENAIATMGDFMDQMIAAGVKKMSDVKSITLESNRVNNAFKCFGVGVLFNPRPNYAAGNVFAFEFKPVYGNELKPTPFGDKANAGKYGDFLSETELSQDDLDDIADMFAGYSGGGSTWGRRLDDFMDQHAAELQSLRRSQASGLGDFNAAKDLGSDELAEGEKADYEDMLKEAVGEPEEPVKETELSQDDRDEIAAMFAGYSGPGSTWGSGSALDAFVADHAAELKALRRSQASGLGDFGAARDLGSDELAESETDLSKASKKQLLDELQKRVKKDSGLWADLEELKDKYDGFDECDACGDDDCVDGEKCGLKENCEAPDEDLNEEIDEIVGADESEEDQEAEAREAAAEQFEPLPDDEPEEDDVLGESFVRHTTMLAKEVW